MMMMVVVIRTLIVISHNLFSAIIRSISRSCSSTSWLLQNIKIIIKIILIITVVVIVIMINMLMIDTIKATKITIIMITT